MYFLTATLRGETFYGVVNAWVLPEGQYGAFRGLNNEIYIMSHKSALNLSYQDRMPLTGQPECLMTLSGQELIGTQLKVRLWTFVTCAIVIASHQNPSRVQRQSIFLGCVIFACNGVEAEVAVPVMYTDKLQTWRKCKFVGDYVLRIVVNASTRISFSCL